MNWMCGRCVQIFSEYNTSECWCGKLYQIGKYVLLSGVVKFIQVRIITNEGWFCIVER